MGNAGQYRRGLVEYGAVRFGSLMQVRRVMVSSGPFRCGTVMQVRCRTVWYVRVG